MMDQDHPAADQGTAPIVVPLHALDRTALAIAGGKAANLGELLRAELPVPPGFCVTTAAYARVAGGVGLDPLLAELAAVGPAEGKRLAALAAAIRDRLLAAPVPEDVARAVVAAAAALGPGTPLAVRSSATAEDLPFASFAGQQETYLNVVGPDELLAAVRRCWASLWTDRAVAYRARNGIDPRAVRLAVVVQRMVDAAVAGVLFTANPLTGRRGEAVVDASFGLGEAVVSGAVNPDHFVVDAATGAILERRLGDKRLAILPTPGGGTRHVAADPATTRSSLTDEQLRDLARLGRRVERHFGAPQDIEFALDRAGALWIVQARPITTLFPLPATAPADPDDLRVYFSFNVAQGVFRPLTPMGLQALRLLSSSFAGLLGARPPDPLRGTAAFADAAGRLYLDVTPLLRSSVGRRLAPAVLARIEARSEPLVRALFADPRLAPRPVAWRRVVPRVARLLAATRLPLRLPAYLIAPATARATLLRLHDELLAAGGTTAETGAAERLDLVERRLLVWPARIVPRVAPAMIAGLGAFALAERLLGDLATPEERDAVKRALPHNPTTEMDLQLWDLARRARSDAASAAALRDRSPADLAAAYRSGRLPPALQDGLAAFLAGYGHRAVAEIDLGMPRWRDDATPLLSILAGYLRLEDGRLTPDVQFREAAVEAEATVRALVERAARRSRLRGLAVRFLLRRGRELAGLREMPKFLVVLLFAQVRSQLTAIGEELTAGGRLERVDDVFFLTIPELRAALRPDGPDPRSLVRERRASYDEEFRRRHVPRLLLSDGTEPTADGPVLPSANGVLRGTPASAGRVVGRARVVLDPTGARLDPGEILVAPSTDPGWTPLFLTAGGLVMEMGGAMSHGAVVAREYGIPAVVGVPDATERIRDGQEVVVNGTEGIVVIS